MTRCGQLRQVLSSPSINLATKLKIYKCAVGSLFTYGNEAWELSEQCLRSLNGSNAGCLHRFTGKTRIEESRPTTTTYSLCGDIRRRRLVWLGHILRMDKSRLVFKAAIVQHRSKRAGNLFMDAPAHRDLKELLAMAKCRKFWKKVVDKTNFKASPKHNFFKTATTDEMYDAILKTPLCTNRDPAPDTTTNILNTGNTTPAHTDWQNILKPHKPKPIKQKQKQKPLTYPEKVTAYNAYCTLHYGNRPLNLSERRAMERDMGPVYKELLYLQAKPPVLRPENAMRVVFDEDSTDTSSELGIDSLHSALHDTNVSIGNFIPKCHSERALFKTTGIRPTTHPQSRTATTPLTQCTPQHSPQSRCNATPAFCSTLMSSTPNSTSTITSPWVMPVYKTHTPHTPHTPPPRQHKQPLSAPQLAATNTPTTKPIWQRYGHYRDRQHNPHRQQTTQSTHTPLKQTASIKQRTQPTNAHISPAITNTPTTTKPIWRRFGRFRDRQHHTPRQQPQTPHTNHIHTPQCYYQDPQLHTYTKTLYSDNYPISPIYSHRHSTNITHLDVQMTQSPLYKPYEQRHLQHLTHIQTKYPFLNHTYIHQQYVILNDTRY